MSDKQLHKINLKIPVFTNENSKEEISIATPEYFKLLIEKLEDKESLIQFIKSHSPYYEGQFIIEGNEDTDLNHLVDEQNLAWKKLIEKYSGIYFYRKFRCDKNDLKLLGEAYFYLGQFTEARKCFENNPDPYFIRMSGLSKFYSGERNLEVTPELIDIYILMAVYEQNCEFLYKSINFLDTKNPIRKFCIENCNGDENWRFLQYYLLMEEGDYNLRKEFMLEIENMIKNTKLNNIKEIWNFILNEIK